ncbi:uncharacterized protein JCM15063_002842 [Sporobolomyces koalae]|uniref:uncharacterized protein n=1 Tax=Sporobolomyces koalae TaxID=500713 RepID=UPI0031792A22
MFGPFASTSTRHLSGDPFAFLEGKQYVTMIREVLPSRFSPSKSTASAPRSLADTFAPSSSSASSSTSSLSDSTYIGTPSWERTSSSSSDFSDDDLELVTPPASPHATAMSLEYTGSGKGKAKDEHQDYLQFSLQDVSPTSSGPTFDWTSPSLDECITLPNPPQRTTVPLPSLPSPAPVSPRSKAERPTRQQEERLRGRSRSPRLLWRSELDEPSISLLNDYYSSTVGGPLPRLDSNMSKRQVREWSLRVEDAGI